MKTFNFLGACACFGTATFLVWMVLYPWEFRALALRCMEAVAGVFS